MKSLASLALLGAVLVSGCKYTTIVDGKIPAGYEQFARQAEGTYTGHIEKKGSISTEMRLMSLEVKFVDQKIVLVPSVDWIGEGCHSKIGNLVSVETSGTKLSTAVFAFDGGSCKTDRMGDRLVIRSFKTDSAHPKLVAWVQTDWGTYSDQGGQHTSYIEMQADLRK